MHTVCCLSILPTSFLDYHWILSLHSFTHCRSICSLACRFVHESINIIKYSKLNVQRKGIHVFAFLCFIFAVIILSRSLAIAVAAFFTDFKVCVKFGNIYSYSLRIFIHYSVICRELYAIREQHRQQPLSHLLIEFNDRGPNFLSNLFGAYRV